MKTVPNRTGIVVYVVAFEPKADRNRAGVGGFNWFYDADKARQVFEARRGDAEADYFYLSAIVSSEAEATSQIDECWGEWAAFAQEPQPVDLRS